MILWFLVWYRLWFKDIICWNGPNASVIHAAWCISMNTFPYESISIDSFNRCEFRTRFQVTQNAQTIHRSNKFFTIFLFQPIVNSKYSSVSPEFNFPTLICRLISSLCTFIETTPFWAKDQRLVLRTSSCGSLVVSIFKKLASFGFELFCDDVIIVGRHPKTLNLPQLWRHRALGRNPTMPLFVSFW